VCILNVGDGIIEKIKVSGSQARVWVSQSDEGAIYTSSVDEVTTAPDRLVGIVVGALVADQLFELLKRTLHEDSKVISDMFEGLGPLASFNAQINLAYLIGLVSERVFKDLHIIRKIRNDFAHSLSDGSFKSRSVADRAMNLTLPDWFNLPVHLRHPETEKSVDVLVFDRDVDDITEPRTRFLVTCRLLMSKFATEWPKRLSAPEF
jgi:hypothetical protein